MATQTLFQEHYLALTQTVKQWDQRLRLRQSLLWLPRSLVPGLVLGSVIALVARLRPLLLPEQIALIAAVGVGLGVVVMLIAVWLWRRAPLTSARRFDLLFRLNERVSTALEISAGSIHTNDELAQRQLEDARASASAVRVGDHLPLTLRRNDWLTVLALLLLLVLLLLLPNPQTAALAQASAQQTAITDAAETLRDLTETTAADAGLSDAERQALLEQLRSATNTLEQPNVTPEEAFAALSDVQSSLQDRADDLNRQASANQAALQQAADALRQAGQSPTGANQNQNQSPAASAEQIGQGLDQIARNAGSMTDAERQAAQQALQNAAQSLQDTNPQAAQQLTQAAQNLQPGTAQQGDPQQGQTQNGDPQSGQDAQQNLQQAQQEIQRQSQQTQQQQSQSQSMQAAADQAQQSAEQVSQAQQSQASQPSQANPEGQSQAGQPQQSQSAQSQPQTGQQGQQAGDQQSQQAQSMQSIQNGSGDPQQSSDQQSQQSPNASSGAGDSARWRGRRQPRRAVGAKPSRCQ